LLAKILDALRDDASDFDAPRQQESFSQLVISLDEPDALRALLRAARRNVELRMELLTRTALWYPPETRLSARTTVLRAFLDDDTVCDRSFPSDFPGIAIRDFAAMHLAKLLELEVSPNKDWSPEQWSALRDQVRERLAQEKLPELE
jgi:hypothetical protein